MDREKEKEMKYIPCVHLYDVLLPQGDNYSPKRVFWWWFYNLMRMNAPIVSVTTE